MFGILTDDERWSGARLSRFARRSFRDVDWGPIITAGINATTSIINAAAHAQGAAPQCPAGYYYDPNTRLCQSYAAQQQGGGDFLSSISPTTLAIGGVVLVLLLTEKS